MKKFEMPEIQVVSFLEDIMSITISSADANYIVGSDANSYVSNGAITKAGNKFQ